MFLFQVADLQLLAPVAFSATIYLYMSKHDHDIKVIYEDDDMLAINKPAGLAVHADGRTDRYTLADWVLETYSELKDVGEPIVRTDGAVLEKPGMVHRLDAGTSGVLLLAKNQEAFLFLKKQFQEREVRKTYRAFIYGVLPEDEKTINAPIGKSKKDFRQWSSASNARGVLREATTVFSVLDRFPPAVLAEVKDGGETLHDLEGITYVSVSPQTGRTHQIRVHAKYMQHPVMCDSLYAPKRPCVLGFSRPALHAFSIEFKTPQGKNIVVEAPLPADFSHALDLLGYEDSKG